MRRYLLTLAFAVGVSSAFATTLAAQSKPTAVATFSILGDMLARVAGDGFVVKTLVGPEGDGHVYQPTPADAAEISKARIVFQNGLKFEGWMEKLIQSSGYRGEIVTATKGLKPITIADRNGNDHSGKSDPHAWQSLSNALIYVRNIKDSLCKIDIVRCATYAANASAYEAEIKALDADIRRRMETIPPQSRKVITSHDAFGYFAAAYGVRFLSPRGISTESEASARDVARLIDQIRKEKVRALFVENIADPRLIEQIGRETGVKPGGTLYSDALSKRGGPAATYLDMMRHNATLLAAAMSPSS